MGRLDRGAPRKLLALRFGAKITLAFFAVLSICAASMFVAHLGLQRIAASDAAYRATVVEADLSREIDRELVSYQAMTRYYAVTGRDDDAAAVLVTQNALKAAILRAMTVIETASRREQIVKLNREFEHFGRVFADLAAAKSESNRIATERVARASVGIRASLEELSDTAALAGLPTIQSSAKDLTSQFMAIAALANNFVVRPEANSANALLASIKLLENVYVSVVANNAGITRRMADIADKTRAYREALAELADKSADAERLIVEMADSALTITLLSNAMKQDLMADQRRMDGESSAILADTKQQVVTLAIGGAVIGGLLALLLGRGMSARMSEMGAAMRKLAGGEFDVILPGLGDRDEFGDMAGAVEAFKIQAVAKASQEAAANEARNRMAREGRRAELARFADEFEVAVGAIVSNVSASSVQLETAADTLLRTAETTQELSSHVAGASEEASSNMQAVAAATEQLTTSVAEIGRRVRDSSTIAEGAVLQAQQTDTRIGDLSSAAQRIGDVVQLITAIAGKTNLLALNATIEAARAGEAGRGFAVVASEVKLLAGQTAKATSEISAHISGIQNATQDSVAAIKGIGETIGMISGIASTIACAVEQQNSATQEISRNIHGVARGTHDVAENIARVTRGASETGVASEQVLSSAKTLATESRRLRHELDRFMANFRAA